MLRAPTEPVLSVSKGGIMARAFEETVLVPMLGVVQCEIKQSFISGLLESNWTTTRAAAGTFCAEQSLRIPLLGASLPARRMAGAGGWKEFLYSPLRRA